MFAHSIRVGNGTHNVGLRLFSVREEEVRNNGAPFEWQFRSGAQAIMDR